MSRELARYLNSLLSVPHPKPAPTSEWFAVYPDGTEAPVVRGGHGWLFQLPDGRRMNSFHLDAIRYEVRKLGGRLARRKKGTPAQ